MAVVVSHAMRRYPTSPPGSSYSSHCLGGEGPYQDTWSREEINESSLSRSMRYAEPWLYGSMRAPGGLLLAPALVLCSCTEYLTGTKRSSKKGPTLCKKCKGTRVPLPINDTLRGSSKFGTVRCYPTSPGIPSNAPPIRPGTVRVSSHARPSILPTNDPYELMRRSRMSPENGTQFRIRVPSPNKMPKMEQRKLPALPQAPLSGRKSILECNINPYDLMTSEPDCNKSATLTVVGGQKVRIRTQLGEQEYEEIKVQSPRQPSQIPKLKNTSANKTKEPSKLNEKESDSNRFKSILKKPTTFGDTDSCSGPERSPSPAQKSGSHFYLPMPMNTPRKKVQFLVENEFVCQEQNDTKDNIKTTDKVIEQNDDDANIYEEVSECLEESPEKRSFTLRRSVSERFIQETTNVVFHDTMALRTRSRRNDSRNAFNTVIDLQKLDGVAFRPRIFELPVVDPIESPIEEVYAMTDLPNKQEFEDLTKQISIFSTQESFEKNKAIGELPNTNNSVLVDVKEQLDEILHTNKLNDKEENLDLLKENNPNDLGKVNKSVELEISTEAMPKDAENVNISKQKITSETPPIVPPRKKSISKQPVVVAVEAVTQKATTPLKAPEYQNKTVVQIRSSPTVHKIQIKNEFLETCSNIQTVVVSDTAQRKTSIMINGDDCYSTINVNDDVPMYQSSVVVKDTRSEKDLKFNKSSSVYITGNFVSVEEDSLAPNLNKQFINMPNCDTSNSSQPDNPNISNTKEKQETEGRSCEIIHTEDFTQLLKDPVEAVKHNLVPHVCGKSDVSRRPRSKKLSDSLLAEAMDANLNKLIEDSMLKLRSCDSYIEDEKDICSEHDSSTQYEMMDHGSDCYTDNSNRSSMTEEELNARTKFYEMLADSAIAEISENEDHHYESIRINSDPIYEEISPPPLPSNPPPSSIVDDLQLDKQFTTRSIFEGASKYDILSYLVDAKERGIVPEDSYNFGNSDIVIEDVKEAVEQYRVSHMSSVSDSSEDSSLVITNGTSDDKSAFQKSAEVERNDSGVGSETSKSSLSRFRAKSEQSLICEDCETIVETQSENEPLICRKCLKKRTERKEIISEIVETEEKYSRDLQIILEEFYQPMLVAGLLTPDQLSAIFLNVEELLENSQALAERLRDAVEIAIEQGDEDLLTVNIGKLFLEAAPMLHAFETYCIRQGNASLLLASLEKEKELLRIFLRVSQMENTMLRRMNLNSFLMVPVQRVTKYPLLLTRLYKSTPVQHEIREQLKEAQHKIELHLNHMNSETKDVPSKLWRRIGSSSGRRSSSEMDLVSIKLRKIAVDVLEWNHDEAKFALEGKLLFTQPTDNNWRKGRTIKLSSINALLVTNGKQMFGNRTEEGGLTFPKNGVREAALLLVRDKNGRYSLLREPLYLDRCIIATDPAWQSYFEVQEVIGKDTFIFKAEDDDLTRTWYRQLQFHAQGLGGWRKRRNALANIMINGMGLRS